MPDSADLEPRVREILDAHSGVEGALLPILHAVQDAFGYVPEDALPLIAADQRLSKAEAYGVLTFYHDFRTRPAGRHVLKLCRAEACKALGTDRLYSHARARLGVDWHGTTADGRITLEPVFCLGLCASGPSAMIDGRVVGRLDAAKFDAIVGGLE